jgi:hypothetical protein
MPPCCFDVFDCSEAGAGAAKLALLAAIRSLMPLRGMGPVTSLAAHVRSRASTKVRDRTSIVRVKPLHAHALAREVSAIDALGKNGSGYDMIKDPRACDFADFKVF